MATGGKGLKRPYVEKRSGRDWMTRAISGFTLVGWGFAIMTVMLFSEAQPGKDNFITRILGIELPRVWNGRLLWFSLILLISAFVFCVVGFVFNLMRHKRRTDRFSKPLIILGCASAVGIAAFLVRFSVYL
jgi:hypothetical protein